MGDLNTGRECIKTSLETLSNNSTDVNEKARISLYLGAFYTSIKDYNNAIIALNSAYSTYESLNNRSNYLNEFSELNFRIGLCEYSLNRNEIAMTWFSKNFTNQFESIASNAIEKSKLYYGMSLFRAKDYNNAINYLKINLENIELNNEEKAFALYYLSESYSLTKDYQNAIIVSKSAINAFEALNNSNEYLEEMGSLYSNIGLCEHNLGRNDNAIEWLKKSLTDEFKDIFSVGVSSLCYGKICFYKNDFHNAIQYIKHGLQNLEQNLDEIPNKNKAEALLLLGQSYVKIEDFNNGASSLTSANKLLLEMENKTDEELILQAKACLELGYCLGNY
jgi:tetratricopeptide (TPR) repeat protein